MLKKHVLWLLAVGGLALGCESPSGTDARDARVWEPSDASVWQPLRIDGGAPTDGGSCDIALPPVEASVLPRCTADTHACVLACDPSDQACRDLCLANDPTPAVEASGGTCQDCVTIQALSCADRSGCHAEVSAFVCCLTLECPAGSPADCLTTSCGDSLTTMFTCLNTTAPQCAAYDRAPVTECFAAAADADAGPADADAGPADAGPADGGS